MNRIGCCSWIFAEAPLQESAARAARAGLDGVELFGDVVGVDPKDAGMILADHGLEVLSVTPGDADIAHPDSAIRGAALEYFRRLMDFAAALGAPLMGCHGLVGRIRPVGSPAQEDALLRQSVAEICEMAAARSLTVVYEILNRYESHQIRSVAEGMALLSDIDMPNLKLLADAYHMNIEEADPAAALRACGGALGLYHVADSNRQAVGEGHTDFAAQMRALTDIGYDGPIIIESNAPGPDPFNPDKGAGMGDILEAQLRLSRTALTRLKSGSY